MKRAARNTPRLMFVLTAAFGELFNAMYMVRGCRLRTAFAMREPWYSLNRSGLPGPAYHFENYKSLVAAIEEEDPDLVCLLSGYLFAGKGFGYDDVERLVKYLRTRRTKTVTSDPFLGLIARLPVVDPQSAAGETLAPPLRLAGEALFGPAFPYLLKIRRILKDVPHVYIVDPEERGVRTFAFHNPNFSRSAADKPSAKRPRAGPAAVKAPAPPYWLFILGDSDYSIEVDRDGAQRFHAELARRLREAMWPGRRAALIAPERCMAALARDAALKGCSFIRNCDYHSYMDILLGAEYAFYWNIFSASILARVLNRLPVFFFAAGHIADENHLMFEKGMTCYYRKAQLTFVPATTRLTRAWLTNAARTQEQQLFAPFIRNVQHLPTPEAVVEKLLSER